MPDVLSFDLKQLVRVCLNDPELRAEVMSAIEEGAMPMRTPCASLRDGAAVYSAIVRSDREKQPGDAGFIPRDAVGWVTARLTEVVTASHDAATMSADQLAQQLKKQ
jgi:hypothetical protein